MGSIDIVKPLSTVLSSAGYKSQQHQEKNYWECRESNLGPLGAKQECYHCARQSPLREIDLFWFKFWLCQSKPRNNPFFASRHKCEQVGPIGSSRNGWSGNRSKKIKVFCRVQKSWLRDFWSVDILKVAHSLKFDKQCWDALELSHSLSLDHCTGFFSISLPINFCRPLTKRRRESNPGRLGEKRERFLCVMSSPRVNCCLLIVI